MAPIREFRFLETGKWTLSLPAGLKAAAMILFFLASLGSANAQSLNPEDVLDRVEEMEEKGIDSHFGRGFLDSLMEPVETYQTHLADRYRLRIFGLLSPIYQVGTGVQTMNVGYDQFVRWDNIIDSPGWLGKGSMQAYALYRNDDLIGTDTSEFKGSRGLAVDINDSATGGSFTSLAL